MRFRASVLFRTASVLKRINVRYVSQIAAYPGYWDGYESIDEIKRFLSGINNLYCIGRNGQHKYNNMDHAMETAFSAVKCIIGNIENSKPWEVNEKAIYNEAEK